MIRLLATDLDGTLVRDDGSVSQASRDAIAAAADAGFQVVFVTGRPTRWLWQVADAVGYSGIVVAANGAITYDLATEKVLEQQELPRELIERTTALLREEFPEIYFGIDSGDEFAHEPGYAHDWQVIPVRSRDGTVLPPPWVGDLESISDRRCIKLLARVHHGDPDVFLARASTLLGDDVQVTHSAQSALLEISAAGVTKAAGLKSYSEGLGIARDEVAAVGDMPNDIPMLRWAGQSYAVANAHPAAKAAAGTVLAESNDDDAVAVLLHRFITASQAHR